MHSSRSKISREMIDKFERKARKLMLSSDSELQKDDNSDYSNTLLLSPRLTSPGINQQNRAAQLNLQIEKFSPISHSNFLPERDTAQTSKNEKVRRKSKSTKGTKTPNDRDLLTTASLQDKSLVSATISPRQISRSKSRKNSKLNEVKKNRTITHDNYLIQQKPCLKEKTLLKSQIIQLQDQINEQKDQIKNMNARLRQQKENNYQNATTAQQYQYQIRELKEYELQIMQELSEQQKVSREALNKLYNSHENHEREIQSMRVSMEDSYRKRLESETEAYRQRIQSLENDQSNLMKEIREIQDMRNYHNTGSTQPSSSSDYLNQHGDIHQQYYPEKRRIQAISTNKSSQDFQLLQMQNEQLRQLISANKDIQASNLFEIELLQQKLQQFKLNERERTNSSYNSRLKNGYPENYQSNSSKLSNSPNVSHLANKERDYFLREIDALGQELDEKNQTLLEQDLLFKSHLDQITSQVDNWQDDLKKLQICEQENNQLKSICQEIQTKLERRENKYRQMQEQWSNIYNELVNQVKCQKVEIQAISMENKRLLTNMFNS